MGKLLVVLLSECDILARSCSSTHFDILSISESLDLKITARKKDVGDLIVSEFGGASDALLAADLFGHINFTQSHFEILLHAVDATSLVLAFPN